MQKVYHSFTIALWLSFCGKKLMNICYLVVGGTLFEFIQSSTSLIEEQDILKYFTQLLLAIQHIHSKQILHRDLKTQNILLDKTKKIVKIVDFGISKMLTKSNAVSVSEYIFIFLI